MEVPRGTPSDRARVAWLPRTCLLLVPITLKACLNCLAPILTLMTGRSVQLQGLPSFTHVQKHLTAVHSPVLTSIICLCV